MCHTIELTCRAPCASDGSCYIGTCVDGYCDASGPTFSTPDAQGSAFYEVSFTLWEFLKW